MAQYDDLNVPRIALVGVISVIVTAVTALAVQVLFYAMAARVDAAKAEASQFRRQIEFLERQREQIASYGVDPDTGNVTVPVTVAFEVLASGGVPGEETPGETDTEKQPSGDEETS